MEDCGREEELWERMEDCGKEWKCGREGIMGKTGIVRETGNHGRDRELWERTEYCETKWRIWERSEDYKRERLVGKNRKFGEKMGNFIKG